MGESQLLLGRDLQEREGSPPNELDVRAQDSARRDGRLRVYAREWSFYVFTCTAMSAAKSTPMSRKKSSESSNSCLKTSRHIPAFDKRVESPRQGICFTSSGIDLHKVPDDLREAWAQADGRGFDKCCVFDCLVNLHKIKELLCIHHAVHPAATGGSNSPSIKRVVMSEGEPRESQAVIQRVKQEIGRLSEQQTAAQKWAHLWA